VYQALEIVVVEAALCALLASFFFERTRLQARCFSWIFAALAVASVGNYFDFGWFNGRGRHVHLFEQYHFFLGSKYLPEVRYDAIYEAALLAASEQGLLEPSGLAYRDPMTFEMRQSPLPAERRTELRRRFSPERWREFREDLRFFFAPLQGRPGRHLTDHGNTGSPAWAMTASLFTGTLPLGARTVVVLGALDVLALAVLLAAVLWAFGGRAAALTTIVGFSVPAAYAYLGGSILRIDWLVALGLSVCLFEKRWFRTAGIVLGYAVASKLFAGVMVLPLGLRFVVEAVRRRRVDRDHLRYVLAALAGLALFVVLAAAYFSDAQLWPEYFRRLVATFKEKYYRNNHSFRDVFLQAYHYPWSFLDPTFGRSAAANPRIFIESVRGSFALAQLALLGGLLVVAVRNPARSAFALGPLAVFVLLVTNRYYWQMWMISALALAPTYRQDWRHATFLGAILAWLGLGHVVESTRFATETAGYLGSFALFWMAVGLPGLELVERCRKRRGAAAEP
jgi:hypothetical protein